MVRLPVPEENKEIYKYIYCIEVVIRELTIELFNKLDGPKWYNQRLPEDSLKKYREGISYEKKAKWTNLIPHHPIYYIDFTDLKKIIERNNNWKDAYNNIFIRKDIISSTLSEIEVIRNKIAHNRKTSIKDVEILRGAYTKIYEAIGKNQFEKLVLRCTSAENILEHIVKLNNEFETSFKIVKRFDKLNRHGIWESILEKWWFDQSYLGCKLDKIIFFFEKVEMYENLHRTRGCGHLIEKWVKDNDIDLIYNNAKKQFEMIIEEWEGK